MSMCVRYQIGPVGVLMVLGVHFCIGGNFLTGVTDTCQKVPTYTEMYTRCC